MLARLPALLMTPPFQIAAWVLWSRGSSSPATPQAILPSRSSSLSCRCALAFFLPKESYSAARRGMSKVTTAQGSSALADNVICPWVCDMCAPRLCNRLYAHCPLPKWTMDHGPWIMEYCVLYLLILAMVLTHPTKNYNNPDLATCSLLRPQTAHGQCKLSEHFSMHCRPRSRSSRHLAHSSDE